MSAAHLMDAVIDAFDIASDAELARRIESAPADLNRIRHGKRRPGYALLVGVARYTDWPMSKIDKLMEKKR